MPVIGAIQAAMEPLVEERGHLAAWRATLRPLWPQWSRSLKSGVTIQASCSVPSNDRPQWSRSLKSGVTRFDRDGLGEGDIAAMEPLVEERGHTAETGANES